MLAKPLDANAMSTKKERSRRTDAPPDPEEDDILPEYDFRGGRRNPYAAAYAAGTNVIVLDPDVAAVFSTPAEVNEALRALARIIRKHSPKRARSKPGT